MCILKHSIINSVFLIHIGLFRISISSWVSFDKLSKHSSFSPKAGPDVRPLAQWLAHSRVSTDVWWLNEWIQKEIRPDYCSQGACGPGGTLRHEPQYPGQNNSKECWRRLFICTLAKRQIYAKQFTGISLNPHKNFGGSCYYYLPYTNEETGTERKSSLSKITLS